MNLQNLRVTVLTVLFAFTVAACDKPISTPQTPLGRISKAVENVGDSLYRASEKLSDFTAKTDNAYEDAAISLKIKNAFSAEIGFGVREINVDTVEQRVTLTGTVDSRANSDKATQIAQAIAGVKWVENQLIVKPLIWG